MGALSRITCARAVEMFASAILVLLVSFTFTATGQANRGNQKQQTNTDFRTVSNKVYNVVKSTNWVTIPPLPYSNRISGDRKDYTATVVQVGTNYLLVRITVEWNFSQPDFKDNWSDRLILLRDYPFASKFATGDKVKRERYFPLEHTDLEDSQGGQVRVRTYTYGKVAQHK